MLLLWLLTKKTLKTKNIEDTAKAVLPKERFIIADFKVLLCWKLGVEFSWYGTGASSDLYKLEFCWSIIQGFPLVFRQSTPVFPVYNSISILSFKFIFLKTSFHCLFANLGIQKMIDNNQAPYVQYLLHNV
jgi:hypothetical protein